MQPFGSATSRPAPIAAAIGSSISSAWLAPACIAASWTALFSTVVIREGTHIITRGLNIKRRPDTLPIKYLIICSVIS